MYTRLLFSSAILGAGLLASSLASAALDGTYSEDFEACAPSDLDALGTPFSPNTCGAGSADLSVAGNVFESDDTTFAYFYGLFPAPNNAADPFAQFTGIAVGEGGANQGAQQLNFFNDYANGDHINASNRVIHALALKEWTIAAADLDKTWVFRYSYKSGDALVGTTKAFISTIEPFSGNFDQTNLVNSPTDDRTGSWVEDIEISLFLDSTIDDVNNTTGATCPSPCDGVPDLQGQIFQIGLENSATNSSPSGMWYDNLAVFVGGACVNDGLGDTDGDGVDDNCDNCTVKANATQIDTDADGHGNACDGDFQNNCFTNIFDTFAFKANFAGTDQLYDLNSTGGPVSVNIFDLFAYKGLFGSPPGPSACGACPCP